MLRQRASKCLTRLSDERDSRAFLDSVNIRHRFQSSTRLFLSRSYIRPSARVLIFVFPVNHRMQIHGEPCLLRFSRRGAKKGFPISIVIAPLPKCYSSRCLKLSFVIRIEIKASSKIRKWKKKKKTFSFPSTDQDNTRP